MLHHLLLVTSPAQAELTKKSLERLKATPIESGSGIAEGFRLTHPLLDKLILDIHLITNLDAITPHLRQHAVDLLVYDERGGNVEARKALARIREDMAGFAELWGPDFIFPMSRVVAILEDAAEADQAFELGRVQIRDVCVAPKNTAHVLRWLARILTKGVIRGERIGMALSGGGLEGFLYQVGVLHALQKALSGRTMKSVHAYSGVSSGAIASALMAANVPTSEVIKASYGRSEVLEPLTSRLLFDIDSRAIVGRVVKQSVTWAGLDPSKWMAKALKSIPTGLFKGEALRQYFKHAISAYGYEDSFSSLGPKLFLGATDMDTFEHVTFGKPPWDKVEVSAALRASCALPPFFTPIQINGRWFIDGQVTRTCNLELLVNEGCRLIIVIDPLKPLATQIPGSVDQRGGVFAMIQTIKALVYTRFQNTLLHLTERYPDIDFLVFQPDEEVAQMMAGSPMRYRIRTQIISIAYRHTLRQLRERRNVYSAKLARFGFVLASPEELIELEKGDEIFDPAHFQQGA